MRLAFVVLLFACSSPTTEDTSDPEPTQGDEEVAPEDLPDAPAEALRPEDAIGFAGMDPTLEDDECMAADELELEPRAWRLTGATLVWLPCQMGAYQPTGALFLVHDDGQTERLALPHADPSGTIMTDDSTGELSYDPSSGVAEDFVRFRGLGDCGRRLRYTVGATGLTLVEHREQACDDEGEGGGPETWPVRYPASE